MKRLTTVKASLAICVAFCAYPISWASDIFTPSPKPDTKSITYPTSEAFLSATRDGIIPDLLLEDKVSNTKAVGRSVIVILRDEYKVPMPDAADMYNADSASGDCLSALTRYELEGGKDEHLAEVFRSNRECIVQGDSKSRTKAKFIEAFDSFARDYQKGVKEWVVLKQKREEERRAIEAEKQRLAEMAEQREQEQRSRMKTMSEAQAASKRAEDAVRTAAVKEAMTAQAEARKQKLQEILLSPAYKIWQASIRIEEGLQMIESGQRVLDHDDAVRRESGVTDLTARRAAGEQIVAGKRLVQRAFDDYRQLSGTAKRPEEVRAGEDPAKEFR